MLKVCVRQFSKLTRSKEAVPDAVSRDRIFSNRKMTELATGYAVYQACKSPYLVQNGPKLLGVSQKVLGRRTTNYAIEHSMGKVFTAGKDFQELTNEMKSMQKSNIKACADFAIEGVLTGDGTDLDNNLQSFEKTLMAISASEGTMAVKITALAYLWVLKDYNQPQKFLTSLSQNLAGTSPTGYFTKSQLSEKLTQEGIPHTPEMIDEFFMVGKRGSPNEEADKLYNWEFYVNIHAFPLTPDLRCTLIDNITSFSQEMEKELLDLGRRLMTISEKTRDAKLHYMTDAEQTYLQYAIDSFTRQMQYIYNSPDHATVLNTFQCYRKDMAHIVPLDNYAWTQFKKPFAGKLVRGAYMTEERALADSLGYESPICDTEEDTHINYDFCVDHVLRNMPPGSKIYIASHNLNTTEKAKSIMKELGDKFPAKAVHFATLKGLSDKMAYSMASEGFETFKYLPFGPTNYLVPYLMRRAEEASYIGKQGTAQQKEITKELFEFRKLHWKVLLLLIAGVAAWPYIKYLQKKQKEREPEKSSIRIKEEKPVL